MKDLHGDAADVREDGKIDTSLDAIELDALEQYYLGEEAKRIRELNALEERLTRRVSSLEALEARLTQGLNELHSLETRLKQELNGLGSARTVRQQGAN